jgi:hypothetical protein
VSAKQKKTSFDGFARDSKTALRCILYCLHFRTKKVIYLPYAQLCRSERFAAKRVKKKEKKEEKHPRYVSFFVFFFFSSLAFRKTAKRP